jgi:hypothetical protein
LKREKERELKTSERDCSRFGTLPKEKGGMHKSRRRFPALMSPYSTDFWTIQQ